jgi:hypothetical protein
VTKVEAKVNLMATMFDLWIVGGGVLYIPFQIFPPIKQLFAFVLARSKISKPLAVDRMSGISVFCSGNKDDK